LLDVKKKMVVEYLVVGHPGTPCECIPVVQNCTFDVWKKDPKTIMSHYEFHYTEVMAWFGVKIQKRGSLLTSAQKGLYDDFSTITPNMAASFTKRVKHVNDSLDFTTGSLREWHGADFHYIEPLTAKEPVCSLCQWGNTMSDKDQSDRVCGKCIGGCDNCRVNLCLKCFKIFHTIGNLTKLRSEVLSRDLDRGLVTYQTA
jgi:hypothetical protein